MLSVTLGGPSRWVGLASFALAASAVAFGCASMVPPPAPPVQADTAQTARCNVHASQERPFVTEWPATERSRLEGKMASGLVAVSYSGCEMQVLDRCRADGSYHYVRTSVATDGFNITNDDDLYAKLPLGAVSLEGELKRAGKLSLKYAVVGQYEAADVDPTHAKLVGDCARATHLITGYAVGAFSLTSGSSDSVHGGVSIPIAGAGAKVAQSQEVIRSSGSLDACKGGGASGPPDGCQTPIQLFLAPLPERAGGAGATPTMQGASAGPKAAAAPHPEAIPALRGLIYLGGGASGGSGLLLDGPKATGSGTSHQTFSLSTGPMVVGALGLRLRFTDDLELQIRGPLSLAWNTATLKDLTTSQTLASGNLLLIQPGLEGSLRFRPRSWRYYAGAGADGSLTWITSAPNSEPPRVFVHGFLELGVLLGVSEEWDLGVHGGLGSSIVFDNPLLFQTTLVLGRSFN